MAFARPAPPFHLLPATSLLTLAHLIPNRVLRLILHQSSPPRSTRRLTDREIHNNKRSLILEVGAPKQSQEEEEEESGATRMKEKLRATFHLLSFDHNSNPLNRAIRRPNSDVLYYSYYFLTLPPLPFRIHLNFYSPSAQTTQAEPETTTAAKTGGTKRSSFERTNSCAGKHTLSFKASSIGILINLSWSHELENVDDGEIAHTKAASDDNAAMATTIVSTPVHITA